MVRIRLSPVKESVSSDTKYDLDALLGEVSSDTETIEGAEKSTVSSDTKNGFAVSSDTESDECTVSSDTALLEKSVSSDTYTKQRKYLKEKTTRIVLDLRKEEATYYKEAAMKQGISTTELFRRAINEYLTIPPQVSDDTTAGI